MQYSRRTSEEILEVRKKYTQFITNVLIYIIIYIFILFLSFELKIEWRKQKILWCDKIKAIQETLSGFLMDQGIDPKDVYYYDPKNLTHGSQTTKD
jgi:Fe2+ transport system protein B